MSVYDEMEAAAAQAGEEPDEIPVGFHPAVTPEMSVEERAGCLARNASIEIIPSTADKITDFRELMPLGARVFVPFLPRAEFADCIPLAKRLRDEGMEPVPHIAARRLRSRAELTDTLAALREQVGLREVLVIAGDPEEPAGPFENSMSVLETGILEAYSVETIFVGGQPEGIPGVSGEAVSDALDWKYAYAKQSPADFRLVTQFVLDPDNLMAWRRDLADRGIDLPLHVGVAGPTSLKTLMKFAGLTGAKASFRAMRKYGVKLTRLSDTAVPDDLVYRLASDTEGAKVHGLHVYTFGGFNSAVEWLSKWRAGAPQDCRKAGYATG
ncbi:methylenetetrahydrofolate reductase [Dichotomicrobium thermohalophilum]|uniref:Methylenetetrahydrofolate reductase n=1 Tax=Dichotomicrobium thermohalophilum TaxID=933063 RepID=A0A397PFR8_9HYPH|nr:methylenetetrahydrofolate reductase [Dichotomicrobium thermohalophilum]RIA47303.1 methylenetetrahydrofolate reductase (NADPH) [Dichotomicrobium thermohalophilum]